MNGRHRGSASQKAAATLAMLVAAGGVTVLLLGVLALAVYALVARNLSLTVVSIALDAVAWCLLAGRLGWHVLKTRPRTAAGLAALLDDVFGVLIFTLVLVSSVGQWQGWLSAPGPAVVAACAGVLLVAMSAYWLGGRRWLAARGRAGI
jgi:hypothetical protein